MADPAQQLQRIYLAGFDLQTFDRFPKCVGVVRDNCIALLVPSPDGLQMLGAPGWRMGEAIGVLVERDGGRVFQAKQEIVSRQRQSGWRLYTASVLSCSNFLLHPIKSILRAPTIQA